MKNRKRLLSRDVEHKLALRLGVPMGYHAIKAIKATWKIRRYNAHYGQIKPCIFAIYHGDLIVSAYELPRILPNVDVLTSMSRDGTIVAGFVKQFKGAGLIRGGSSKGGTGALLEMRRSVVAGKSVVIPVDGPRGPYGEVKPGIIALASQTGAPIIPGVVLCDRSWILKSWDKMQICKPFSMVHLWYGDPIYIEKGIERDEIEAQRLRLQQTLHDMHQYQVPPIPADK